MLDLQKRIQEDYYDTLMKRISQRQVSIKHLSLISFFPAVNFINIILIHLVSLLY